MILAQEKANVKCQFYQWLMGEAELEKWEFVWNGKMGLTHVITMDCGYAGPAPSQFIKQAWHYTGRNGSVL
jgi:hypothetical protein